MIGQLLTGRYLILKTLGSGGFSETYLARDKYLPHHPLCVVKCLKVSSDSTISSTTAQQLFATEAQILERLGQQYEQIPTLFAYCHEADQVYQVQEYIDGENLEGWINEGRHLTIEGAIDLLSEVLPVLNYIHSHQVIHRDIKPSNLIRRQDGKIVLIDFGAARLLSQPYTGTQGNPEFPLAIGTPGYMPNEQEAGNPCFNSDLYGLGIAVIHLFTGVHPREFQVDPISGELDWHIYIPKSMRHSKLIVILDRMVRRRSRDRYPRATDVIAALFPLIGVSSSKRLSRRPSTSKRSIAKPMAAALLACGLVGGWLFYDRFEPVKGLLSAVGMPLSSPNLQLTLLHDLPMAAPVNHMLITPDNRRLITAGTDHVLRLWSLPDCSRRKVLAGHTDTVTALNISQDGHLLVSAGNDRTIRLWDTDSGQLLRTFRGHQRAVTAVALSADARTLVSGSKDGTVRLWDRASGKLLKVFSLPSGEVTAVAYGAASRTLISASSDRRLEVWDLQTGKIRRTFAGHTAPIMALQLTNDHTLFSFGEDRVLMWDLQREELVQAFAADTAKPATVMLDDQHMMTIQTNGSIHVWTRKAGQLVKTIVSELGQNLDVALSPDHRYLVSWSPDQRLRVWQMQTDLVQ